MKRRWTREGEMMIDELRATYANMTNPPVGNEEEMDKGGRDDEQRVESN